jgi:hypothetical protein
MTKKLTAAARVIQTARGELGTHEGRSGGHWNNLQKYAGIVGHGNGFAWCATFVAAIAKLAGVADLYPNTASCDVAGRWFKDRGRWSEYPAVGAQVFYGTAADLNHTGIVVAYDADTITTIEGNTNDDGSREGDGVYLKTRDRRSSNIVGYGYPRFPEGIVSADPAYAAPKPPAKRSSPWRTALDALAAVVTKSPHRKRRSRATKALKELNR